jgi:Phosphate transporter family
MLTHLDPASALAIRLLVFTLAMVVMFEASNAMEQAQPLIGPRAEPTAPAQGAAAEVISAAVIGVSGFTGLPVSTTHIVTSGIGGTMVSAGAGLQYGVISRILMAWVFTLPVTMLISAGIYYFLADPRF